MERQERPQPTDRAEGDISVTRARQGVAPHIVRYVLGIGLVLAVVALGLTLFLG